MARKLPCPECSNAKGIDHSFMLASTLPPVMENRGDVYITDTTITLLQCPRCKYVMIDYWLTNP